MQIKGCRALVTGASSGLGLALCEALIASGASLVTAVGRRAAPLDRLQELGSKQQVEVITCALDFNAVNAPEALEALFAEVGREQPLDLVIACAGVSTTCDEEGLEDLFEIERALNVNVKAALCTLYLGAGMMLPQGRGCLTVISSLASLAVMPSSPLYGATKSCLNYYAQALGECLDKRGITVLTVLPGFITTPMSQRYQGRKTGEISASEAAEKILKAISSDKRSLVFPRHLGLGLALLKFLPQRLRRRILKPFAFTVQPDAQRQAYEENLLGAGHQDCEECGAGAESLAAFGHEASKEIQDAAKIAVLTLEEGAAASQQTSQPESALKEVSYSLKAENQMNTTETTKAARARLREVLQ